MQHNRFFFLLLSVLLAAQFSSMGCEGKGAFDNTAPSKLSLSVSKCFIETEGTVQLTGSAEDEDGDSLTFSWKAPKGTFSPVSAKGKTVSWTASDAPGVVSITMTVTDEVARVSKTQSITVCTPFPSPVTSSMTVEDMGSPYILLGADPLMIPAGVTLTIKPGVTIIVDGAFGGFEVYGHMVARGTPSNPIRLLGNGCSSEAGLWGGVYLEQADCAAILENMDIAMSTDGIQVNNGAWLAIDSCEIYDATNNGISVFTAGSIAEIYGCNISDNGGGIYVLNAEAHIRRSSIRYSSTNGIELSFSLALTTVTIDSCSIANNGMSGIQLSERAAPEIHYCSIFSNGENAGGMNYGVRLASYVATNPIHAENNYWGLGNTTAEKIGALIYDATDNPVQIKAYVTFTPWLNQSPVMASSIGGAAGKGRAWAR